MKQPVMMLQEFAMRMKSALMESARPCLTVQNLTTKNPATRTLTVMRMNTVLLTSVLTEGTSLTTWTRWKKLAQFCSRLHDLLHPFYSLINIAIQIKCSLLPRLIDNYQPSPRKKLDSDIRCMRIFLSRRIRINNSPHGILKIISAAPIETTLMNYYRNISQSNRLRTPSRNKPSHSSPMAA